MAPELSEVLRNRGDGIFDRAIFYATPGDLSIMAATDFDGDARQDIVTFGRSVAYLRNNGCLP